MMTKKVKFAHDVERLAHPDRGAVLKRLEANAADAMPAIIAGLSHVDPQVRKWCVSLLDHHATAAAVPGLVKALEDPVADVRRHAVHSVGCQSCKEQALDLDIVDLLIKRMVRDPSLRVRRSATHMLGNQPRDPRAAKALAAVLRTETDVKTIRNAEWSLSKHEV